MTNLRKITTLFLGILYLGTIASAPLAAAGSFVKIEAGSSPSLKVEKTDKSNSSIDATFNGSLADLVEKLIPTVVNISIISTVQMPRRVIPFPKLPFGFPPIPFDEFPDFGDGMNDKRKAMSAGSGFFISADGYIVTSYHLIADAEKVVVKLYDQTELEAQIIGTDKRADVALLKVTSTQKFPYVVFGDSNKVRTGDRLVAIGNPFGLGGSVTSGIVSSTSRDISAPGVKVSEYVDDFIQTDAPINQGNSGGPLFNLQGEVIAIATAIYSPTGGNVGLAFCVPSRLVKESIDQIKKFGKAKHGWIGVHIQPVTEEIAESLGLDKPKGALVAMVVPDSPAAKAGLKTGDVILKFNEQEIKESRRIPRLVGETEAGKKITLQIWRDKKESPIDITIGEFEAAEEAGLIPGGPDLKTADKGGEILDMELHALTRDQRERFEIKPLAKGVLVTNIKRDSQAWTKGIRPGDLITEVDQEGVESPHTVISKIETARKAGKKTVLFLVNRGDEELMFVALKLDEKKPKADELKIEK